MYGDDDRYQIILRAENIPNVRLFGKACPYAKVKVTTGPQKGKLVGQTEPCMRYLSPNWTKIIFLEFSPSEVTELEVAIYDYHKGQHHKWMGEATFEATSVFQSPGKVQSKQIGRREDSRLYISIEKSIKGPARGHLQLHLRGLDMKNVEPGLFGLGRSDPFFEVAKKDADYSVGQVKWNTVYRSEHIDNNLNPYWRPTNIGLEELCYGDLEWPLKVSVFDYENSGKHRLIGEFETTIADLQNRKAIRGNADREQAILLSVEEKFKTYGLLCVLKAELSEVVLAQ
ncbi:C2 domain containing protein [Nitzschia inconspicua]|uniref:C2 domain containing protein n=1 Tax=Nitzschia inconspicua TaxID=303405 RepID=A0A9K3KU74_9STRA|nr:C2 domain containing protein [Nitzschia inconspicua]